jgi:hypothetical protein
MISGTVFWIWSVPMLTVIGYFDPGSGSLLVQVIAGGAAGLLVFAKYLWDSVPAFFGHKSDESPSREETPTKSPQIGR